MTFPVSVLLMVVEHADYDTIMALESSSKAVSKLLTRYERSITTKNLQTRFGFDAASQKVLLTSCCPARAAIPTTSFMAIEELEIRESRMDELLDSPFFQFPTCQSKGLNEMKKFEEILVAGMREADKISDLEAETMLTYVLKNREPDIQMPTDERARKTGDCIGPDGGRILRRNNAKVVQAIRDTQKEYISGLSNKRIIMLHGLSRACEGAYLRQSGKIRDAVAFEHGVVFAENVLQHGTFFLWGWALGQMALRVSPNTNAKTRPRVPLDIRCLIYKWQENEMDEILFWTYDNGVHHNNNPLLYAGAPAWITTATTGHSSVDSEESEGEGTSGQLTESSDAEDLSTQSVLHCPMMHSAMLKKYRKVLSTKRKQMTEDTLRRAELELLQKHWGRNVPDQEQ